MKIFILNLLTIVGIGLNVAVAQVSFSNQSDNILPEYYQTNPSIVIGDMNGDFLDDIVTVNAFPRELSIGYQVEIGQFLFKTYKFNSNSQVKLWALALVDIDRDGFNDLVAGYNEGYELYINELQNDSFQVVTNKSYLFSQNISVGNINGNDNIDIFLNNDIDENYIVEYDKNLDSTVLSDLIPHEDILKFGGNYGSSFVDVDNDCDQDLYLAKCKVTRQSPTDPERINILYLNEGGTFVKGDTTRGVSSGSQSWTGTFGDLDNDLDMDLVMTNHSEHSLILLNDGSGYFSPIEDTGFYTLRSTYQSVLRDFDNNGFLDILITGEEHALFFNNGDNTYADVKGVFEGLDVNSCAVGDLNQDGFIDVYSNQANVITRVNVKDDQIYINEGNDNNYIGFHLMDDQTKNVVSSKVYIYGDFGVQYRELTIGDSYGISNSHSVHFGLGQFDRIDSVVVLWPNGCQRERFENVEINKYNILSKGTTTAKLVDIPTQKNVITICRPVEVTIFAELNANETVRWHNGQTTKSMTTFGEGVHYADIFDESGRWNRRERYIIAIPPRAKIVNPSKTNSTDFCADNVQTVCLRDNYYDYTWSNGKTDDCLTIDESTTLYGVYEDCYLQESDTIEYSFYSFDPPQVIEEKYDKDLFQLQLTSSDSNSIWYSNFDQFNPLDQGLSLTLDSITTDTSLLLRSVNTFVGEEWTGGKTEFDGTEETLLFEYGGLQINVDKPFYLKSVDVKCKADDQAQVVINELGTNKNQLHKVYDLVEGINTLDLDVQIASDSIHIFLAGSDECLSNLDPSSFEYPYNLGDGHGRITKNVFGDSAYYYFYNFKLNDFRLECESEWVEYQFIITSTSDPTLEFNIYPNPSSRIINIENPNHIIDRIHVYDALGSLIISSKQNSNRLEVDLTSFHDGIYFMHLFDKSGKAIQSIKIMKLR